MTNPNTTDVSRPARGDWLGGVLAAGMWCVILLGWLLDIQSFAWFLWTLGIDVVLMLTFMVWWFTRRSVPLSGRFLILGCAVLFGIAIGVMSRRTIALPAFLVLSGMPIVLMVWWVCFMLTFRIGTAARLGALVVCIAAAWSPFLLVRMTGYQGNLRADLHWRWTPTAEQLYLAERGSTPIPGSTTQPTSRPVQLRTGDWPAFRGPGRDAVVRDLRIGTDWSHSPPKVVWRQRVGPAWSSMAVVDGLLFTQEQRSDHESVVCREAAGGHEVWAHDDPVRFEEAMSGLGPRATPAFDNGRIYAQGTLGKLMCLDAATGRLIWSRDVRQDTGAPLPMWGFCNSPLIMDDRVIVFAGGDGKKSLVAYSAQDGHPLWTADAGKLSYASPQAYDGPAGRQILMFTNEGFYGIDPSSGQVRWNLPIGQRVGLPAALQACQVGAKSIVLGNGAAFGAERLEVSSDAALPAQTWVSPRIKPAFSDMVYHDGFIYGFDGTVFCCVDATTGARRWREGRFGAGQAVVLANQGVLIVLSEDGQVVLLRCNPDRYEELGRLQAISGKAWNHLAVAGNCLYVRSDAEMACLELPAAPNP